MRKVFLVAAALLLMSAAGLSAADFNGDGTTDVAIFRASNGLWSVRGLTRVYFGGGADQAIPGDYNGDGVSEYAIFRPSNNLWRVRGLTRIYYGQSGDQVVWGGNPAGEGGAGFDYKVPNNTLLSFRDSGGTYQAGIRMATDDHLWIGNPVSGKHIFIVANEDLSLYSGQAAGARVEVRYNPSQVYVSTLTTGTVYSSGGVLSNTAPSSVDYKDSIRPLDLHAERILKLEPKSFVWRKSGQADFGYIAEEVREVVPELYREDGDIKGYDPAKLSFYLTEVVKTQDGRIAALEAELQTLKSALAAQ